MREILFRGKRKDNGEWAYGYYGEFHNRPIVGEPNSCQIFEPHENASKLFNSMIGGIWHIVNKETVGQYTGLTDRNGKQIFEGDIMSISPISPKYEIKWDNEQQRFCFWNGGWIAGFNGFITSYEVIGNIYDNPELLGGRNNG